MALGDFCHDMRSVTADRCFDITDDGLVALAEGCPRLEEVHLVCSNVGDDGVEALVLCCPSLVSLNLNFQYADNAGKLVTNRSISHMMGVTPQIASMIGSMIGDARPAPCANLQHLVRYTLTLSIWKRVSCILLLPTVVAK